MKCASLIIFNDFFSDMYAKAETKKNKGKNSSKAYDSQKIYIATQLYRMAVVCKVHDSLSRQHSYSFYKLLLV